MSNQTWEATVAEIMSEANAAGVTWPEVRAIVVDRHLEENPWPEGEGLGSSDMNCILVEEWRYDPDGVRHAVETAAWRKKTLADLAERGVDLERMAELFAPAE